MKNRGRHRLHTHMMPVIVPARHAPEPAPRPLLRWVLMIWVVLAVALTLGLVL